MAIVLPYLTPTVTSKISAPTRAQRKMTQPDFYEPEESEEAYKQDSEIPDTAQYVTQQLDRYRQRAAVPELEPAARVTETEREAPDFRTYYNRLNTIADMGQEQLAAVQAKKAFSSMTTPTGSYSGDATGHDHGYTGKWAIGKVLPHVSLAAQEVGNKFGIATIHGVGSRPNASYHPGGRALDFMVGNNMAKGQAISDYVTSNWGRLGVTEIIWNGMYSNKPGKWVKYTGPNPHRDHPHVSFRG